MSANKIIRGVKFNKRYPNSIHLYYDDREEVLLYAYGEKDTECWFQEYGPENSFQKLVGKEMTDHLIRDRRVELPYSQCQAIDKNERHVFEIKTTKGQIKEFPFYFRMSGNTTELEGCVRKFKVKPDEDD